MTTPGNSDPMRPGEPHAFLMAHTILLPTPSHAEFEGSGVITHVWITLGSKDPMYLRNVLLRMYWDGETKLPNRAGRMNMTSIEGAQIHLWREVWRQFMGGGALWGDEELPENFRRKLRTIGTKGRRQLAPEALKRIARREQKEYDKMLNRRKKKR